MEKVTKEILEQFLQKLGERFDSHVSMYLIGGSALILLGATRETIDIDYLIQESNSAIQKILKDLSNELYLDIEYVALGEFIPLPEKAEQRHRLIGHYGKVDAYIFDPHSIALSKLDRGFESDIEDIIFLIKHGLVSLSQLEQIAKDALPQSRKFDINPHELEAHLQAVRDQLN